MRTLVVIPTYNEKENVAAAVRGAIASSDTHALVVDDGSPDGTAEAVRGLMAAHPGRVHLLERAGKQGLGSAYRAGFARAIAEGYDMVCEMDADGSHDPTMLPALIGAVAGGADLSLGSRRVPGGKIEGWAAHRHLMSTGAMTVSRMLLGLRTKDVTSGFRCYRISLASRLLDLGIRSDGYAFQEETLFHAERLGSRIVEIPIVFRDRKEGISKLGWRDIAQFFGTIVRLRFGRTGEVPLIGEAK